MFKTYFTIAFRNFRKFKVYSFINVFGLAVGFASALVIGLWVYQEWSYDRHFEHADRIYRVGVNFMNVGDMAVGPPQFNEYIRDFPEVEKTTALSGPSEVEVTIGDQHFKERRAFHADSTFFEVFSYNFVQGNRTTALDAPNSVALTRELARKYFSDASALGRTILIGEDKTPYVVTGVVDTGGHKSHINAHLWLRYQYERNENWLSASVYNYVLLKEGVTPRTFSARLDNLIETHVYPSLAVSTPYAEWKNRAGAYRFIPIAITDIYLSSELKFEPAPVGSKNNVVTFGAIAVLIILIAGVNYINITTARASIRAKEVGVRKTLGSSKGVLVAQFLSESVIVCGLALLIAFGLGELFLNLFEKVSGVKFLESLFVEPGQMLAILIIAMGIGVLAGLYPAFYLTAFEPVRVLKGQIHSRSGSKSRFRNALVLLQFSIAICLLIGTAAIFKQLQFMRTRDLGLSTDNVLVIDNARLLGNQTQAFKHQLLSHSGVERASYNKRVPAGSSVWVTSFKTQEMQEALPMQSFHGDYDMIPTLGFRIIQGRNFSRDLASDSSAVILNQSAVQALGLQQPIGAILNGNLHVIGVVADFNFESLRKRIEPVALTLKLDGDRLAIKLKGDGAREIVQHAESLWNRFGMSEPMHAFFLDENFENLLQKERILSQAVVIFTILAVLISCLGLYGLSAYMTEQRTKEVSIRKVLGAKVTGVIALLSQDFLKLVLLANLIAWPVAWYAVNRWLENFAYRIDIGWWVFALAGGLALFIALATVSIQALKAALANPVDSLRYE